MSTKPVVHYRDRVLNQLVIGNSAYVYPINHPSEFVSNRSVCRTSPVIRIGEFGEFETHNTIYRPVKP